MSSIKLDGLTLASTANSVVNLDSSVNIKPLLNASGSAPIYACRAWVNFDGTDAFSPNPSTSAIRDAGNVASITENVNGDYTINFATAMEDTNYSVVGCVADTASPNPNRNLSIKTALATSSVDVITGVPSTGAKQDMQIVCVSIFR